MVDGSEFNKPIDESPEQAWVTYAEEQAHSQETNAPAPPPEPHEDPSQLPHGGEPVTHTYDETPLRKAPVDPVAPPFPPANLMGQREPTRVDGGTPDHSGMPRAELIHKRRPLRVAIAVGVVAAVAAGIAYAVTHKDHKSGAGPRAVATSSPNPGASETATSADLLAKFYAQHLPIQPGFEFDPTNPDANTNQAGIAATALVRDLQLYYATGDIRYREAAMPHDRVGDAVLSDAIAEEEATQAALSTLNPADRLAAMTRMASTYNAELQGPVSGSGTAYAATLLVHLYNPATGDEKVLYDLTLKSAQVSDIAHPGTTKSVLFILHSTATPQVQ